MREWICTSDEISVHLVEIINKYLTIHMEIKLAAMAPTLATVEHTPMAEFLMRRKDQRS